ncbi:MAG: helix-turn-helix domain-containing protein [Bacteroidota bacterium]|nr:helix-turn-helix domain-containing protein [Bacteroidota bacterium]
MSNIEINSQFEQVLNFVNQTNHTIFLTGKAGTGKTTLLKYIKQNTFKQIAIVAPTGVAAINAGGSTIHSFFQFPFTPFLPAIKEDGAINFNHSNLPTLKYNSQRLSIFRNLELLVIDEISMVRADMLDQIDITLRQVRRKTHLPFGGVQVLLIGDMYQLPPVVQQEEWKILNEIYKSPYFFDSLVIKHHYPVYIELNKIYRQKEQNFVDLLNKVRNNNLDEESLEQLNSHYKENITQQDYQTNITLTTHNKKADEINSNALNALPDKAYKFRCVVDGSFNEKNYPADEVLVLKKGTRVMFLKNNPEKNYYNGKIGIVTFINDEKIKVKCEDDASEIEVIKETWNNITYQVDKASKHITEDVIGTFAQYPLRLAWAITIHKSQGLTFSKLIIDAAEAFSAGQVYVALSRCSSLQGLTLSSKIDKNSLLNDAKIVNFASTKQPEEQVESLFSSSQKNYIKQLLLATFDLSDAAEFRKELAALIQLHQKHISNDGKNWAGQLFAKTDALNDVSNKFKTQLSNLIEGAVDIEQDEALQNRLKQAGAYFETELQQIYSLIKNTTLVTESKEAADDINTNLQQLIDEIFTKKSLTASLFKGFNFKEFIKTKLSLNFSETKVNVYASSKNTKVSKDVLHPKLYKELLLLRDEICNDEHKPIYLVANNKTLSELTNFLPTNQDHLLKISGFGQAKVDAFGDRFLKIITSYMLEHDLTSNMEALKGEKKSKKTKVTLSEVEGNTSTKKKPNTKEQTYLLYTQGIPLVDIAKQRNMALSTIEGHLTEYIAKGDIDINKLVDATKQEKINEALKNFNQELGIASIKNSLPTDITYTEIRYMIALKNKK